MLQVGPSLVDGCHVAACFSFINPCKIVESHRKSNHRVSTNPAKPISVRFPTIGEWLWLRAGELGGLATGVQLTSPSAVSVTPDNVVHVADTAARRVYSVLPAVPAAHPRSGHYQVPARRSSLLI